MDQVLPQLIIGLGNPGPAYRNTRHNAGFVTVDSVAERAGPVLEERTTCESMVMRVRFAGRNLMLAKPQTMMNLSGRAVTRLLNKFDVRPEEILVVYDCLDLPLGKIRLRQSGSSGGHKGMESVIRELGTEAVPRLRFGIGRVDPGGVVDHVLTEWAPDEVPVVRRVVDAATDAVLTAARRGVSAAMNACNSWSAVEPDETDNGNVKEKENETENTDQQQSGDSH